MVFAQGIDGGYYGIWDGLSKFYTAINIIWTSMIIAGCIFLILNRNVPSVRIRNLPISLSAVLCLHVYWSAVLESYTWNGLYPCGVEFWVMSIYLPFGIALFQATNVQLLSVAATQGRMIAQTTEKAQVVQPPRQSMRRWWLRYNSLNLIKRTELAIGVGMLVQVILTTALFFGSRKFVSYGVFSEPTDPMTCRTGGEWVPSILWQFSWAWIFAPYVLWKIRHIRDVHHWRLQTIICVVAGLPGSPLWLASLYARNTTGWANVNRYWTPAFWFAIPIMTMEAVTIFVPCYGLVRARSHRKYIAGVLQEWEHRRRGGETKSLATNTTYTSKSTSSSKASKRSELYTRGSFEKHLSGDTASLLHFAAAREFTGENIVFLNYVRDWKTAWLQLDPVMQARFRMHFFKVAVEIFVDYVDLKAADFPINIESHIYTRLQRIFGDAAKRLSRPVSGSTITPFAFGAGPPNTDGGNVSDVELVVSPTMSSPSKDSPIGSKKPGTFEVALPPWSPMDLSNAPRRNIMSMETRLQDDIVVPAEFDEKVFDQAQDSVKYMVFLNTWPKFVDVTVEEVSNVDEEEGELRERPQRRSLCFK